MRKLHAVVGRHPGGQPSVDTLTASGLFAEPETDEFGTWRSGVGEGNDMDTWGMPDCQSNAAFPLAAAPVPVSLRMATNRICQADCHEESCGNAL